jgi:secondary thiamine-phosphate synthase enzyme
MIWEQKTVTLGPRGRGFHIVTDDLVSKLSELKKIRTGIAHFFIKHTSASLTLNENADPTVREDMESHFNHMVPEDAPYYRHTLEGPDDMTSHIKSSLLGSGITVPITDGASTWVPGRESSSANTGTVRTGEPSSLPFSERVKTRTFYMRIVNLK